MKVINFLRENQIASAILLFLRLYLGWSWLTAGWGKVTGGFDASGFINGSIGKASGDHPAVQGWWASFLENVALPNVELFNILVPWGELLVGLGLILGGLTTIAIFFALVMNFSFLLSGTISTNPQMIILSLFILIAGYNAGKIGLDFFIHKIWNKYKKDKVEV